MRMRRRPSCAIFWSGSSAPRTEYQYPDAQKLAAYKDKPGYYADHVFVNRPNVYGVCRGTGGGRSIMLSGHIDVVQRGTKWTHDPFAADCVDGRIYGRGAVDMKGGIASMLMAVKAIQACGLRLAGDVKFGTVVDEEAGGMGTLALMAAGYRADACMISEPTDLQIAPLCRGILWGRIVIPGRAGHIEMPQPDWRTGSAVDAIEKGRIYLHAIRNLNQDWAVHKEHKYMKIPCQINIAEVHAGNYPTTYAERCEIVFDAQYLPAEKTKTVWAPA
jgi:acetylornithine deacetylase